MNLLAIETSSPLLSVAIKKSGAKVRHAVVQGYMKHAENLLPVIDRLLKREELKIGEIDAFLISRGPGSFTGLRIGFATLKGFLSIRPKPCYGASSLDVIAAGIKPKPPANLTVCLDARRGKLYACSYRYNEKGWRSNGPSRVLSIGESDSRLSEGEWIAGNGIHKLNPKGFRMVPEKNWIPRAATLIKLFETKHPFLKRLRHPKEFLPAYLRSSEPEEKLKDQKYARAHT